MPDFTFTSPEGKKYTVKGPEGATQEQAYEMLQRQLGGDEQQPSAFADFFRSMPRKILEGMIGTSSAAAQAELGTVGVEASSPQQQLKDIETHVTGKLPEPAGRAGKYGGEIAQVLTHPLTYAGGGSLALKAGLGVASAVGGEAGAQMLESSGHPLLGRFIGSTVGGTGAAAVTMEAVLGRLARLLPNHDAIRQGANNLYTALRQSGTQLSPEGSSLLHGTIIDDLESDVFRRRNVGETFAAVDELMGIGTSAATAERAVARRGDAAVQALHSGSTEAEISAARQAQGATAGVTTSVAELDTVRQLLTNIAGTNVNANERNAARRALDQIDAFLMNVPDHLIVSGNPRADAEMLRRAQAMWSVHKNMELVERATVTAQRRASASGTGANAINTARQEIRKIIDSERKSRGLPQNVRDQMERLVAGTWMTNSMRWGSKFAPTGAVSAMSDVVIGHGLKTGGPALGWLVAGGGFLSKILGEYLTDRQMRQVFELMRRAAPSSQQIAREIDPYMAAARRYPLEQAVRSLGTTALGEASPLH